MRALVHVSVAACDEARNIPPVWVLARHLNALSDWWPTGLSSTDRSSVVANTHLLLARIPDVDRRLAVDSYVLTLYHAPTKSWVLVGFPSTGVADFRIFNPDPEDLKDACRSLVHDLNHLSKRSMAIRFPVHSRPQNNHLDFWLNPIDEHQRENYNYCTELPNNQSQYCKVRLDPRRIRALVWNRAKYEEQRAYIADTDNALESVRTMIEGQIFPSYQTDSDNEHYPAYIWTSTPSISPQYWFKASFPRKIIVLQPDVPERAFEGSVIAGRRVFYAFRKRAPESIVALLLIAVAILYLGLQSPYSPILVYHPSLYISDILSRVSTAFISTGVFTLFAVYVMSRRIDRTGLIEWQSL